jgi:hypothetical protein
VVTFISDKQLIVSGKVVVMNDTQAIITGLGQPVMYTAIANRWQSQFGE